MIKLINNNNNNKLYVFKICIAFNFWFLENWSSSPLLKDVWKIKGIVDESDTYEHNYVELASDDEHEQIKQTPYSHSGCSGIKDNEDESSDSDNSEVCGGIASNKFAALDVSD